MHMRLLVLLCVLVTLPQVSCAKEPSSNPSPPPGAIRLPEGYRHERQQGIDSTVGRIWKEGGLEIHYDIGRMAGNYAGSVKGPERVWAISQVVNGRPVEIVKAKDGRVVVTFTKDWANFYAKVSGEEDLAALLAIVLTYPAAPTAG
jgi:hypothetical protein